ncbi:head maturation protease, ClpP-related [Heyndrickxia acidicola]|uniref:ATP-dependent Clp protease proteolytic subunit n=1 Tax=Heyndrickxia acidicola TaxID=209389 RepID=A0ABU6MMC4_9BACI|nr:head maturation protease, ClpP-related [Heyndrickxia acidicola]MED1205841.1 Clp protease ClpP [Heyndrickxia acidicola]
MKAQHKTPTKFWNMQLTSNNEADVYIFGEVVSSGYEYADSDVSAMTFKNDLDALGSVSTINLHLNSPGGSVFDGMAIGAMLKQNSAQVNVYIDGLAASIASVIAMSGDTIFMPSNAMMMVHQPWSMVIGSAEEMRKQADTLDKISASMKQTYLFKAGDKLNEETLDTLLNNETWLSAQDCINYGLADEILPANQVAASISEDLFARYSNVPKSLLHKEEPVITHNEVSNKKQEEKPNLIQQKLKLLKELN